MSLTTILLFAAILNFCLGFFVWLSSPKSIVHVSFALMAWVIGGWVFLNFLLQFFPTALLFEGVLAIGPFVVIATMMWLAVMRYGGLLNNPAWIRYFLIISALLTAGFVFYDHTVIDHISSATNVVLGPYFFVYASYLSLLLVMLIGEVIGTYRSVNAGSRSQLRFVGVGLVIFAGLVIIFDLVLPLLGVTKLSVLDSPSSLIFVLFSAYAITRHGLFNIKVIATQSFIVLLLLLILIRVLSATTAGDRIFESVVFVFTAIIGYFLAQSVQGEVKRRQEVEQLAIEKTQAFDELEQRNKNLRALQKVADIVLNEADTKTMAQQILDELPNQLEYCVGGFLSVVRKGQLTAFALTGTDFGVKMTQLIGADLAKYSAPITRDLNRLHETLITKQTLDGDSLADFISPPIPKPAALNVQRLLGIRHVEAFPLYAGGVPFGVLLYAFNASKEQIHVKNLEIAKSIADEMSLAIQRAEAFQQLKDANDYLSQLDKMKDEFISMASHELNTPLAAIEGYLSMILDEHMGKVDAKGQEYLSRAYASSKRLAELILDLLNVSRVEQGRLKMKFSQANLTELAESVIHELQIKADAKKIYLKLEGDKTKLPATWCDPDRIREVLVNLVGNAIKFTEKGGVTIKVEPGEGQTIKTSVIDTGRGIATEDQKKLFQKFSQIHREIDEHQGTGLGLYISKNFVELHKGRLWVESAAGKGATFSFELPILKAPPKTVEGAILEGPLAAPKIEQASATPEAPAIIAEAAKRPM